MHICITTTTRHLAYVSLNRSLSALVVLISERRGGDTVAEVLILLRNARIQCMNLKVEHLFRLCDS